MKSITIHKIDDETEKALVEIAEKEGVSLNKLIKKLLRESLGLDEPKHRADFESFCGLWSDEEADAFDKAAAGVDTYLEEEWA